MLGNSPESLPMAAVQPCGSSVSGVPCLGSVLGPESWRGPLGYHVLPRLLTVTLAYVSLRRAHNSPPNLNTDGVLLGGPLSSVTARPRQPRCHRGCPQGEAQRAAAGGVVWDGCAGVRLAAFRGERSGLQPRSCGVCRHLAELIFFFIPGLTFCKLVT